MVDGDELDWVGAWTGALDVDVEELEFEVVAAVAFLAVVAVDSLLAFRVDAFLDVLAVDALVVLAAAAE